MGITKSGKVQNTLPLLLFSDAVYTSSCLLPAKSSGAWDTIRSIALEWFEARTTDFTEKHRGTVMYRLKKYIFPVIGKEHIARMVPQDILKVVLPIEKKGQNETARRLLQIIGQIYRYAVITGRAKRNPVTDLHGAIRPRSVTHSAAITEPKKVAQLLRNIDGYEGYFPIVCALKLGSLVFFYAPDRTSGRRMDGVRF